MGKYKAHIYLFVVNLFYGAGFTISKLVMPQYIKPFGFILLRVSVTTTLFFLLHKFWIKEKIAPKDFALIAVCGLFGVVINQELFFLGLSITTPINASLIMIMTPILVFVISFFLAHEAATWQKIAGIVAGAFGALIIISGKGFNFSGETVLGDLFILTNAVSYAIYLVIVRPLMKKYHPLTVIKWVFFFGLIPVSIFGFNQFSAIEWSTFPTHVWLAVAFVIICTTFFAYLLNILALREVHSSVVGAYIYLQPVLATIISISLGKDQLDMRKIVAALLIFAGVFLVSFAGTIKTFNKPKEEPDTDDMLLE
jgi:drug/metabolite transporter (DMT)-like permease